MNLMKAFKSALLPVFLLIFFAVLNPLILLLINMVPLLGAFVNCIFTPLQLLINILLFLWIGWAIKKANLDFLEAAVTGGVSGAVATFLASIVALLINTLGFGLGLATGVTDEIGAVLGVFSIGVGIVLNIVYIILVMIIGAVLSVVGFFIADVLKK